MIGTGYVGLVSGACFSDFGHEVVCVDKDARKIELLHQNVMPIYEPGLAELVASNVKAGRLTFTTDLAEGVRDADAVFIAVGTPSRRGDGHADLSYVYAAAEEIAGALTRPSVIVTKSTVPVGTGDEIERIIAEFAPESGAKAVSNPEFLREGAAIEDFKRPDRVVVGTEDEGAIQVMRDIYRPLSLNQSAPILFTGRRTAELIKYAANAFLATKITFINEIADLAGGAVDVGEVGMAVAAARRRADRDEDRLGLGHGRGELGGEGEPSGGDVARDQPVEAGLEDRNHPAVEVGDLAHVLVDAGDVVAEIREAGARDEADIARPDNRNPHEPSSTG